MVDLGGQKKTSATKDSIWGTASRPLHILADYIEGQMSLENKRLRETLRTYIGHEERYNGIINQMHRARSEYLFAKEEQRQKTKDKKSTECITGFFMYNPERDEDK